MAELDATESASSTLVLDNDFVGSEPPGLYESWSLADKTHAAMGYWGAVDATLDNALIREFGVARYLDFVRELFASHQRKFFLPGLEKLGIAPTQPDAMKAASYHVMSNAIAGIRTRLAVDSPERAWVLYYPATGQAGQTLYDEEEWMSIFQGWHARNGGSLGNPGLVFVATHLTSRGDPFTGGYFLDTGSPVEASQRFRTAFGEPAPAPETQRCAEVPAGDWPDVRRQKAMRNFAVHWTWDRIVTALELYGDEAGPLIGRAVASATHSYLPVFASLSGAEGPDMIGAAFPALLDMSGWRTEVTSAADAIRIEVLRDPVEYLTGRLSAERRMLPYDALREGWSRPASDAGVRIRSDVEADRRVWTFGAGSGA